MVLNFSTIKEIVCETALAGVAMVELQLSQRRFLVLDAHFPATVFFNAVFLLDWLDDAMLN